MNKLIFTIIFLTTFSYGNERNEAFLKMCNNPTASQKITLEAIAKAGLVKNNKDMCFKLSLKYIISNYPYIYIHSSEITDLTPLLHFPQLRNLSLSYNKIKDISLLKNFKYLEILELGDTLVDDLRPLENLKNLKNLNLYGTKVIDLSPLNNIKSLERLSYSAELTNNEINIKQIKDLKNLKYLGTLFAKAKNFCLINNFTKLKSFSPSDNVTSEDLSCLTKLKKLDRLSLKDSKITNLDFIVNFPELKDLFINDTKITNIDILKKVPKLEILNISNTKITDASAITGKDNDFTFSSDGAPLKRCSPKNSEDIKNGKSCYEKDGSLKVFWKRWLGV